MLESEAFKTYHAYATGEKIPKPKYAKNKADPESSPTKKSAQASKAKRLKTSAKVALSEAEQMKLATKRSNIQFHSSHVNGSGAYEGTGVIPGVPDVPTYDYEDEHISWKSSDKDGDDEVNISENDDDQNDDNDDDEDDDNEQTESDNDGDDFVHPKLSTHDKEERHDDDDDKMDDSFDLRVQTPSYVESPYEDYDEVTQGGFISNMLNPNPDTGIDSILNLNTKLTSLVDVPVTMNVKIPPSSATTLPLPPIPLIQPQYQTTVPTRIIVPNFINKLDENIKKIIKEQVKVQVKEQVTKILLRIEKFVNKQLEYEVLTCLSNEAKTSHAVAANLSELELKKILIDKMKSKKSIHRLVQQKTLYKALIDAYETNNVILDTYGDSVTIKRRQEDEDDDEEPFAGSNQRSKRRRTRKEPESTKASQHPDWFQKLTKPLTLDRDWNKTLPAAHGPIQPWIINLAQKDDSCDSFNELMDIHLDFSALVMNRLKVDTLALELLAGPTFELMKGYCKSLVELEYFLEEPLPLIPNLQGRRVIPFDHIINNDLAYLRGGALSRTYATSVMKTKAADYGHIKWIEDLVLNTMWSPVPVVYDKRALWKYPTEYANVNNSMDMLSTGNWLVINDDKLYTFKEGDYKRLLLHDIKDMLLLLTQGVESYQKKLNLTRQDTYISDLKRLPTYSAYSNPRGFIYHNKDKKVKLIRIDELYKFSDGTLNDVWIALDDILKRIRMKYLPKTFWKKVDKERAGAMFHAIDKQLKNRRIIRSLEKFMGGRPYEGDFRLLERTI
nr:hypothetical protein [Tanacetum cinerariifolium]